MRVLGTRDLSVQPASYGREKEIRERRAQGTDVECILRQFRADDRISTDALLIVGEGLEALESRLSQG